MAVIYTNHFAQFFDDNGDPLNGGKLYTYEAGTTTPKDTYTTEAATVANTNPVILDSAGRATVFINGSYKFALYTSANVLVKTTDNITSFTAAGDVPAASLATEDQAKSGTDNTKVMTPLRVKQSIGANGPIANGFRLTLTSGTPVTTADVTAASTLYLTPYVSNNISLFSGTYWELLESAEVSLVLTGLTSGKPYDVFVYSNSGVVTIELLVWTNDTTRATALTKQDGVYVKTGDTTRRYLGTIYTTNTTTTEDSYAKRYLWNYYNRVDRPMVVLETTSTWTYTTATFRQANNSTANQLNFIVGVSEDLVSAGLSAVVQNSSGVAVITRIGLDSTTAATALSTYQQILAFSTGYTSTTAKFSGLVAEGRHYLAWQEYSTATGTTTWGGTVGGGCASGLTGKIRA